MKNQYAFLSSLLVLIFISTTAFTTLDPPAQKTDKKSQQLLKALEKVNGGWERLAKLKDVEFQYTYDDKAKGLDISTERYIFTGETSWAEYSRHEVNVMPGKEGLVRQRLMKGKAEMTMDGQAISDEKSLGTAAFLRHANFYWFTMMYKLNDPGTIHEYLGQETVNGINYDKVSLTYENTGKPADDVYILYFNPKTHLVDQFYFSLPAWNVHQPVLRMELSYEKINGVWVNSKRKGIFPNAQGEYQLGGEYTYTNIRFNNGFTEKDLSL